MLDHEQMCEMKENQCGPHACGLVSLKRELFEQAHNAHEREILDFIQGFQKTNVFQPPFTDCSVLTDTQTADSSTQISGPKEGKKK